MIDDIDRKILDLLQHNSRTSNAEIARTVGLAASAVFERIKKLEERGVIRGYSLTLDAKSVSLGLTAFMFVRTDEPAGAMSTAERLAAVPEVQEVHHIAGEDCYLLKVRAHDTQDLGRILKERIGAIPAVRSTRTTIVLQTLKETNRLLLERAEVVA